jgi:flagellar protein FlaG
MPVLPVPQAFEAFGRQAAGRDAPATGAAASRAVETLAAPAAQSAPQPIERVLRTLRAQAPALEFVLDGDRAIVKVVDRETGEVLRQIPAPEAIAAGRALEHMQGILLRLKA